MLNSLCVISVAEVLSWIGYAFIAVLILLIMITVHEFGHYIAGKLLHFKINEFSIGFGPSLYSKDKKSGEKFSLRLIPLGGYCAFEGEDDDNENPEAFNNQKPYKRLIVLAMGAIFNFLFALLIIIIMFFSFGQSLPKVEKVFDSAEINVSEEYILQKDDLIVSVEGRNIYLATDLTKTLKNHELNEFVNMQIVRNGERIDVKVLIRKYNYVDENNVQIEKIGLGILQSAGIFRFGFFETLGRVFVYAFKLMIALVVSLGQIIVGMVSLNQIGGPITTIVETTKIVSYGFMEILEITAFIGINLAVFNLLPIPSLDGSRIIFTLVEMIRKKPINKKVERIIHSVGLMAIFIFVILIDILHFIL